MKQSSRFITGRKLLKHSKRPERLRAFLENRPDRIGADGPSSLCKSITVLSGRLGANLHIVEGPMLDRTGKYSPSMRISELGNVVTAEPDEQRIKSDHINPQVAVQHLVRCTARFLRDISLFVCDQTLLFSIGLEFIQELNKDKTPSNLDQKFAENGKVLSDLSGVSVIEKDSCWLITDSEQMYTVKKEKDILNIYDQSEASKIVSRIIDLGFKRRRVSHSFSQFRKATDDFVKTCRMDTVVDHLKDHHSWCSAADWFEILRSLSATLGHNRIKDLGSFRDMLQIEWEKSFGDLQPVLTPLDESMAIRALIVLIESARSQFHLLIHRDSKKIGGNVANILIQGAGDVSMNFWNVAYIGSDNVGNGTLIHAPEERPEERQYSCLIYWKDWEDTISEQKMERLEQWKMGEDLFSADGLSIGRVRFSPYSDGPDKVRLVLGKESLEIRDDIQFALCGQLLAWKGEVAEPSMIIGEFSDLRHVLGLADINPSREITEKEIEETTEVVRDADPALLNYFSTTAKLKAAYASRPRYVFGVPSNASVWLGESAFLENYELAKVACGHPVDIKLSDLGAPLDWITVCMRAWGYRFQKNRDMVSAKGDFAWDIINPTDPKLVWFPYTTNYPCSIIGIGSLNSPKTANGKDNDTRTSGGNGDLFLLEWGHDFQEDQGYTIFECAQILCDLGAQAVLLIDEGRDVFLHYFPDVNALEGYLNGTRIEEGWSPVPPARGQIRGTIAFWNLD